MRTYALTLTFLIFATACNDKDQNQRIDSNLLPANLVQNPRTAGKVSGDQLEQMAAMQFTDTIHHFGNVYSGEEVTHEFIFTNTGNSPLLISSVSTTCGCTIADYPKEPVLPGESGAIKTNYKPSSDQLGYEEKTISVLTNTSKGQYKLYIKAQIISQS